MPSHLATRTGAACAVDSTPSLLQVAAHAWPSLAGDQNIPESGVLAPPLHTLPGAAAQLPPNLNLHHTSPFRIAAIVLRSLRPVLSRRATLTSQVSCLLPVFTSATHWAAGLAAHSVTAQGVHCAVCCLVPVSSPVSHWAAESAAHSVTAQGVDWASLPRPASLPFRHSQGRVVGSPP